LKYLAIILSLCLNFQATIAQMNIVYSMSVIGGDLKVSNSSNPLTINSVDCIKVSNGVTKFLNVNNGNFSNYCIVNLNYTKLQILISPNPFMEAVIIKFKSKIDKDNHFKVSIFNNYGYLVKSYSILQDYFFSGYKIQLSDIPPGVYFIHINSSNVNEVFKVIKNE
jgi:hypothetical protein